MVSRRVKLFLEFNVANTSFFFISSYPDSWFTDITSSGRFYSLAAELNNRIIGMLVAEIKLKKVTDREEYVLLSSRHHENTQITYILSLGVHQEFRRLGIGRFFEHSLYNDK